MGSSHIWKDPQPTKAADSGHLSGPDLLRNRGETAERYSWPNGLFVLAAVLYFLMFSRDCD